MYPDLHVCAFILCTDFSNLLFFFLQAGIVFTFTCGKSAGGSGSSAGSAYNGMGAEAGTASSSDSYQDSGDNKAGVGSVDF